MWFPYWQKARSPQASITGIAMLLEVLAKQEEQLGCKPGVEGWGNNPCVHGCPHRCCFMSLQMELKNFLWDPRGEGVEKREAVRAVLSDNTLAVTTIRSHQSLSRVRLVATPWIAARQASLSITNSRSSLRLTSIDSVMPSSHLTLWRPLLLLPPVPPGIRVFSNESTLRMRWPKYWSFTIIVYFEETGRKICSVSGAFLCLLNQIF